MYILIEHQPKLVNSHFAQSRIDKRLRKDPIKMRVLLLIISITSSSCGDSGGEIRTFHRGVVCSVPESDLDAYVQIFDIQEEYDKPVGRMSTKIVKRRIGCSASKDGANLGIVGRDISGDENNCEFLGSDNAQYIFQMNYKEKTGRLQIIQDPDSIALDLDCKDFERLIDTTT